MKNKAKTKEKNTTIAKNARLNQKKYIFHYSIALLVTIFLTTGKAFADSTTSVALGVAAGVSESQYHGVDSDLTAIPIVFVDNSWISLLGTTIDLKVAQTNSLAFSIRGKYAFGDGYDRSDSYIFDGMNNRDSSFWIGPAMTWSTTMFDLKLNTLLDTMNNSEGQQASVSISKKIQVSQHLNLEPSLAATWYNDKYVNYYYGVNPSEIKVNREQYDANSATVINAGLRFNYIINKNQSVAFNFSIKHFGSEMSHSPLVDKKTTAAAYLGYIYRFK